MFTDAPAYVFACAILACVLTVVAAVVIAWPRKES